MTDLYLALVHYPVYNKNMQIVTTAVTNFDIHDIARSAATYDVQRYYIVHPNFTQKEIVDKILDYWQNGYGRVYNPDRNKALENVVWKENIAGAVKDVEDRTGKKPIVVTTDAREYPNTVSYVKIKEIVKEKARPLLVIFGTGWGIEKETMKCFDYILEPIRGASDYNHLCVRSAAAIILDRLAGEAWWEQ